MKNMFILLFRFLSVPASLVPPLLCVNRVQALPSIWLGRTHAEHPGVVHLEDPGLQTDRPPSLGRGEGRAGRGAGGPGNGDTMSCHGEEAP